jgi:hypothetical protein
MYISHFAEKEHYPHIKPFCVYPRPSYTYCRTAESTIYFGFGLNMLVIFV